MFQSADRGKTEPAQTISLARHNRVVIVLVALCCLSAGMAIGATLRGIAARAEDNRLTASTTTLAPDALSAAFARVAGQVEPTVVNIKVSDGEERSLIQPLDFQRDIAQQELRPHAPSRGSCIIRR